MNFLKKLFGNVAGGGLAKALQAVDGLHTSAEEKAELRAKLTTALVDAQAKVLTTEAGGSWLTQSWRPLVMLSFCSILLYTYFVAPMFGLKVVDIPQDLWALLKVGIGGYIGGRSVEKLVPMLTKRPGKSA